MLHGSGGRSRARRGEMRRLGSLLTGCLFVLAVTEAERFLQPGRRACSAAVESRMVSFLVSYVHPVYRPYLTMCQGQRLCSTYSTTYRVSHRQAYRTISRPAHRCCPGWRRASGPAWLGCSAAVCQPPCQNGGKCALPNTCTCPAGWTGRCCQTDGISCRVRDDGEVIQRLAYKMLDVDECAGGGHGCSQACLNVAGSYSCTCQQGHRLQADGKTCQAPEAPTDVPGTTRPAGASNLTVQEDVKELRSRVLALEEKLQLTLAPFLSLERPGPEGLPSDALSWLLHVWQQVDRVDSLSEQISFLEERLETCTCQPEHAGRSSRKRSPPPDRAPSPPLPSPLAPGLGG